MKFSQQQTHLQTSQWKKVDRPENVESFVAIYQSKWVCHWPEHRVCISIEHKELWPELRPLQKHYHELLLPSDAKRELLHKDCLEPTISLIIKLTNKDS